MLVGALAAPATIASPSSGLQVVSHQVAGNQVRVSVVNSSSETKTGLVVVDAVVFGLPLRGVAPVVLGPNGSISVSVGFLGWVGGVTAVGIIHDEGGPI
jgi:hypothetical protein